MGSSFSNFLLNGQPPPNVTTGSTSVGSLPAWYNSYLSSLANSAVNIASQPYQQYQGTQVAPLDTQQAQAYNFMGEHATDWQSPLQQAQGAAASVAGGFNAGQFDQYLSPYTHGVTDEIQRLGMQNLNENLLPTLNSQFVGSGQFASDRNATMDERLVRDVGANISGQQALANQGAFTSAMGNYLQGQNVANQGAQNLGGLAQMQQQGNIATAGALSASGQTMQQQNQAGLDVAYQNWLNQLNYPRQNLAMLSGLLQGANFPTSQNQNQVNTGAASSYSASPLAAFAGSLFTGMFGNNTGTGTGTGTQRKRGGYIRLAGGGSPLMSMSASPTPMRRAPSPLSQTPGRGTVSPLARMRRPATGAGMRGAGGLEHLRLMAA